MTSTPHAPALAARVDRLRDLAAAENRLEAVLLYGSWTTGEADEHSDIEAYLYVVDAHLITFDGRSFVAQLAPLRLAYVNLYDILTVIFDDLMRGEFHVEAASTGIPEVSSWQGLVHLPDPAAAVLLDRSGQLTKEAAALSTRVPPEATVTARQLVDELTNWTLMLVHVLRRGEVARAHHVLHAIVSPFQLQLCRLLRGSTDHWLTPSRALERDLTPADIARYAACTAPLQRDAVTAAAAASWQWTQELAAEAADRLGTAVPVELHRRIASSLG